MTNSQKKIVLSIPELDKSFDFQFEEQLPRKEFAVYKGSKSVIDAMRSCTFNIDSAFTHIELQLPERNSNLQLANASAKGICRYDDSGLHFLFQVKGVKHFPAPHSSDIWKGSCMQFALNGRRLDQPYALSLAAAKTTENIAVWDFFAGKFIKNVKFNWKNVGNIQYYYMAIPWKILSFDKIPIGKKISFSATYNNSNGKEYAGYLEWTKGICNGTSPNEYGNLVICE